jgi:hypothetical protein
MTLQSLWSVPPHVFKLDMSLLMELILLSCLLAYLLTKVPHLLVVPCLSLSLFDLPEALELPHQLSCMYSPNRVQWIAVAQHTS